MEQLYIKLEQWDIVKLIKQNFGLLENPLTTSGYAKKYGIPQKNIDRADFIQTAIIKTNTSFVTLKAPGVGANSGGNRSCNPKRWCNNSKLLYKIKRGNTMIDYYKKARKIAIEIQENGYKEISDRIIESLDYGTSSTEILMTIRWNLNNFINSNTNIVLNKKLEKEIIELINELNKIL